MYKSRLALASFIIAFVLVIPLSLISCKTGEDKASQAPAPAKDETSEEKKRYAY